MALDLIDVGKVKVTAETEAYLQMESRLTGKSKQEIIREITHEYVLQRSRYIKQAAKLLEAFEPSEGNSGESRGKDEGTRRSPPT